MIFEEKSKEKENIVIDKGIDGRKRTSKWYKNRLLGIKNSLITLQQQYDNMLLKVKKL